VEPRRERM